MNADARTAKAILRHARVSAQKARLVVDMIRGKKVEPALSILKFSTKKTAPLVYKLVLSAVANARENHGMNVDRLWISTAFVDEGRTLKRFMPRAQGRATPIRKRSSHITIELMAR